MSNLTVEVFDGDVVGALSRFKTQAIRTGLFKELKRHDFYVKPSMRRRRKSKLARARLAKTARRRAAGEAARLLRLGITDD
jgi:small subunit ribosomal protein S21